MLLLEDARRVEQARIARGKNWGGVSEAKRLQLTDFFVKAWTHVVTVGFSIDGENRLQVLGRKSLTPLLFESGRQLLNAIGGQGKAGRLGVAAEALEQMTQPAQSVQEMK